MHYTTKHNCSYKRKNWSDAQKALEQAKNIANEEYQKEWIEMSILQLYIGEAGENSPEESFATIKNQSNCLTVQ